MTTKVSVFIITFNEAAHIEEAIKSVSSMDEIILVDSGSTDDTVKIAERLGVKTVFQPWLGYAKQKSFAMNLCKNEWCFNLDGDEIVPKECLDEIIKIIESDKADAIRLPISDYFMGQELPKTVKKRSIVRLFKKNKIQYPLHRNVHENVIVDGTEVSAKNNIIHWGYNNVELLMSKQNQYSSLRALDKITGNKKSSYRKIIFIFPLMFIKSFFIRGLWRAGIRGFIYTLIECMYAFLKEAKLYEHESVKKQNKDKN